MEPRKKTLVKLSGLALALCLTAVAGAQFKQEYYERETNQHLGTDATSYFTIQRVVRNGENSLDTSDLYTYRDSTFLVRRSLDGKDLLDKTLLRAEHRELYYDGDGEPQFNTKEDFVINKKSEELLPEGFQYAKLENPIWPCSFDYRTEGIYLVHEDQERFLVPVTDFEFMFPEYMYFPQNKVKIETVDGYSSANGWYYVSFAPDCMTDPIGICRQVVVPIPEPAMMQARNELLGDDKQKE